MDFRGKDHRAKCYAARDAYFDCIGDQSGTKVDKKVCKELFAEFESLCGKKWTEHFVKRRDYLRFKEKLERGDKDIYDSEKLK